MRAVRILLLLTMTLLVPLSTVSAAERSEIPDKYKWDRTHLFASDADWEAAKDQVAGRVSEMAAFEGKLGKAETLYSALSTYMDIRLDLERVFSYASMLRDEDSRVSKGTEMEEAARSVYVDLGTATSYMQPELIALGKDKVRKMVQSEPKLAEFKTYLDDILRWAPHTLSAAEEKIAALAGNMSGAGGSFHSIFTDADMPYPEVALSTGETVRLDAAGYSGHRDTPVREDRILIFQEFWKAHQSFTRTFATSLNEQMKAHQFNQEAHNFDSSVEAALFNYNIPVSVYKSLIENVHASLPSLHRYLKIKEKMLGLDQIRYEDLYTPIVKEVNLTFTPEEAIDLCIRSNGILGEEYVGVLSGAFEKGWMDIMPSTGKRSGAYSTGVYDVHPYQLLNFNGSYDDVSTMAHESGHSMHTYLASKKQPYVTSDYSIFVAEVASTLNENLLFYSMLEDANDRDTELFLLGSALENYRTTVFRQTLFAEFELTIHEMVESGQPLTADNLNELYLGLLKKYYGHDEGVCQIDDLYAAEWSYISHFYYNFYVYQYATSLVAGTSLAKGVRDGMAKGDPTNRDKYLNMLASGSSKYPVDLLKDAGVDMTTNQPFEAAMKEMNEIMDRLEAVLARPGSGGSGK